MYKMTSKLFLIGLVSVMHFQVSAVLEFPREKEMRHVSIYKNKAENETDVQPTQQTNLLIEKRPKEFENNVEMEPREIHSNVIQENDNQSILSNISIQSIQTSLESNILFTPQQTLEGYTKVDNSHTVRKIRSKLHNSTVFDEQFKEFCSSAGSQPCTCYYPDHPSVPELELSMDEFTKNASGLNGTGPGTCQDLKALGYTFKGFFVVRFNSKRVKTIYCSFKNETEQNTNGRQEANQKGTSTKEVINGRQSKSIIRFCGNVKGNQCTYLYSDHPDASNIKTNKTDEKEPSSCEDLRQIGHTLQGFYMVRSNTIKVKIVFCDFLNQTPHGNKNITVLSCLKTNNTDPPLYCKGLGSQPCSCYYSNSSNILQFDLSNDDATSRALSENGTGPTSCTDLQLIGYKLKGFYLVRSHWKTIKIVFCDFFKTLIEKEKNSQTTQKKSGVQTKIQTLNKNKTTPSSLKIPMKIEDQTSSKQLTTAKDMTLSTAISTLKPQAKVNDYDKNQGSVDASSKPHIVNENDGKSYLLKNKRKKCVSSKKPNPYYDGPPLLYEADCDPRDVSQYWRRCGNKQLCNHLGKLLSKQCLGIAGDGKVFSIKYLELDSSENIDQKWIATDVGQLVDSSGLCLGVQYKNYDQTKILFTVDSCNKNDSGQFWSFESILTPYATISTPRPQFVNEFQFSFKSANSLKQSTKMIPLNQKDGKSYHLINKRNRCISSRNVSDESEVEAIESNCNATEKRQLWKWSGDSLCSNFGCLSKVKKSSTYFRVLLKTEKFHSLWVNQNWSATEHQGQLESSSGLCLGVEEYSSDFLLRMEPCDKTRNRQMWSFYIH